MQGGILWPILDHRRLPEKGSLKRSGGPKKSMTARRLQLILNVGHWTVWKILKDNLLYRYHIQHIQALLPADSPPCIAICQ